MSYKWRTASISDIHTGHPNTSTELILTNLRYAFPDTEETGRLDIIFFGGDFFDRLLNLPDDNVTIIELWMIDFLAMCRRRNIVVLVVEGTPTHDWRQNKLWVKCNARPDCQANLTYIDTLAIHRVESLGMDVLMVPDEWRPETDDTWKEVQQLLQAKGLEQVDFTILHGAFAHQLPEFVDVPKHDPDRYLSITRYYVFGAHIHTSSQYKGRLLANGSFDRLVHGEEEPKGHWRVAIGPASGDEIVFIENKGARRYHTVDCTGLSVEDALVKLEVVATYPAGTAVRVLASKVDAILGSMDLLRKLYPLMHWTTKVAKSEDVQKNLLTDMRAARHEIHITSANLTELMMPRLRALTTDDRLLIRCEQRLKECA